MPMNPIKINCQVCKGTKKVDSKYYQDFFSIPIEERDMIEPEDIKIACEHCKGEGYTRVDAL